MRFICILYFGCFGLMALGQPRMEITDPIREVYAAAANLQLEKAKKLSTKVKQVDPNNHFIYLVDDYIDFFTIFISEDKDLFDQLEDHKKDRLLKIREVPETEPFRLFAEAEINIHWAIMRVKFDEKLTAARELYRAYSLLERNKERFPSFELNDKSLSFFHVLTQSVPGVLRRILRVDGTIAKGTQEIANLYDRYREKSETSLFDDEINIIYAYILFYQNNLREEAWALIEKEYLPYVSESPLILFVVANMAQKMGKTDLAIRLIEEFKQPENAKSFYYLDLLLGKWKLYRLEVDAHHSLNKFIHHFKGRHFIKEAYQKLAWYHLVVKNDLAAYKKHMNEMRDHGYTLVDEDAQAEKEATSSEIPHPELLKARLLYDGGYYRRSHRTLVKNAHVFQSSPHQLEYRYRMGRVNQALQNFPDAIENFSLVLKSSEKKSYLLCNSALQIGLILEGQGRMEQALDFLERCLKLKPDRYKNSLHQKAKSAMERIKEQI